MRGQGSRQFHAQAVVLRHSEYGEADRILTLYTLEYGKMQAAARGVRKIKSRKAGHLEPFTQVAVYLAKGSGLAVISQADAIRTFDGLRANLLKTAYAAYVVELIDRFSYEEAENPLLYKLLVDTLLRLEGEAEPALVIHYYEIHLLEQLGFRPELQNCVSCGEDIRPENQYFSPLLGGALCAHCRQADHTAWPVSMPVLKYMRHLQRTPWAKLAGLTIPAEVEKDLKSLLERYLTYLLEHSLKTPAFLKEISDNS
ncbi:MAG: DNA repair protein RecO [Anaerolineaceae bacterium]|nr:DNA repair protein RecO [Anaerolineaceae bacterium]